MRDNPDCFWHSPDTEKAAAEARRLGGIRRRREKTVANAYDFEGLASIDSIRRLIEIAAIDALGLENSIARSRLLIRSFRVIGDERPVIEGPSRWSTRAEWFDWFVLSATILLAVITIWVGSSIVRGAWDFLMVSLLWGAVGVAWSLTVLIRTTDRVARFAVWALLVGSLVTVFVLGPVVILIFSAWVAIGLLVVVPVGLLLLRQRLIRLMWSVAPAIVVATAALVLSGVPRSARFAVAEAELTGYVQSLDQGAASLSYDDPITVGGLPIYEVVRGRPSPPGDGVHRHP